MHYKKQTQKRNCSCFKAAGTVSVRRPLALHPTKKRSKRWFNSLIRHSMTEFRVSGTARPLSGQIRVPADKSITHRALMLAPLLHGETRIENYLDSETTRATLNCMRAMGANITEQD